MRKTNARIGGKFLLAFLGAFMLTSCATSPVFRAYSKNDAIKSFGDLPKNRQDLAPLVTEIHNADGSLAFRRIEEFFATDRDEQKVGQSGATFGTGRGDVSYGRAHVSVPADHTRGRIESNLRLIGNLRTGKSDHIALSVGSKEDFFVKLNERVGQSADQALLVFIPGYNNSFTDAARVMAQLAYDIEFSGAAVFFSWASQGGPAEYFRDGQTMEWSQVHIEKFLSDALSQVKSSKVSLVCHSMGCRGLTKALLFLKPAQLTNVREIVLIAPDIDTEVFKNDIGPKLASLGRPVTLYVSEKDLGLKASHILNDYSRVGDSSQGVVILPGVQTIDVTQVDASVGGHDYFSESREVMSDLYYLIKFGQSASQRFGLKEVNTLDGRYWDLVR